MQPRSLQQVLSELDSVYNPQIDNLRSKQAGIPGQMQAEEQGLQAKQEQAYGSIVDGARRRGLGFSGIPLGEQAKYSATEYMPALARLRQQSKDQAMSLEEAILGINERRNVQGQSIFEGERNFAEQRRQFDQQMAAQERQAAASRAAAAASAFSPSVGYGGGGVTPSGSAAPKAIQGQYGFKNGQDGSGGFSFTDARGNPMSAYQYATVNKINFNDLLTRMASSGDTYARNALNSMGGAGAIDRNKYSWLFNTTAPKTGGSGGW